ncbi:MAG: hypothetical protein KF745_08800 [Phycisphaeraceae bacterium]|nr:hypothetical protein [Phycisphaeraceae bacterium]
MVLEHWERMVRRGSPACTIRRELGLEPNLCYACGPNGCGATDPDWCFDRFGMSRTTMPDGRIICIGGEHDDWYVPDFCIYNDVIVLRPAAGESRVTPDSGGVEIYGYPRHEFPPTDFHSATLAGDRIVVIGRVGYPGERTAGITPVVGIDTTTYRAEGIATSGIMPGWIHDHHGSYDAALHAVTVRGGKVLTRNSDLPNLGAYRLHLDGLQWECVAECEPRRRYLLECDDPDRACEIVLNDLRPARTEYQWLGVEYHSSNACVDVRGVRVKYDIPYSRVQLLIEGDLPQDVIDDLIGELLTNLVAQNGIPWRAWEVASFDED